MKTIATAFLVTAWMLGTAYAQSYPSKPVTLVVGSAAGGQTDMVARISADRLHRLLGQPFVVENKPGPLGVVGAEAVGRSTPDGYTLLMTDSTFDFMGRLPEVSVNPNKDLVPVGLLGTTPYLVVVHPSVPAKNMAELIALLKKEAGKLNYATSGPMSGSHAAASYFLEVYGTNATHIPYRGLPAAVTAVAAGEVQFGFLDPQAVLPFIKDGKVRVLAVTSKQRFPRLPDVPSIVEADFPGGEFYQWYGLLAPAGTSRDVIERLSSTLGKALKEPDLQARLLSLAITPMDGAPQSLRFIREVQRDAVKRCCGTP